MFEVFLGYTSKMPIIFADYQPKTLEQAVEFIIYNMDSDEHEYIKKNGTVGLHHGFGMAIRNNWNLWKANSVLAKHFQSLYGLGHADDMSGMILKAVEANVTGKTYDPRTHAKSFRDYWEDQGIDALTLTDVNLQT